ncbi:MAG: TIGR01777 family oxidoreductase [Ignavibacteria bacterium]|nr:TIGR01777 family oxidoreductase [Ignavibacteria bacterium]
MKKIIITGATGSIGHRLVRELTARGDEVIVFTRDPEKAAKKISSKTKIVKWDYESLDDPSSLHYAGTSWMHELNGVDAVVHLAGANLGAKRWNAEYKKLAYDSRIISTRNLVEAIKSVEPAYRTGRQKPKVFICSSAVGIYGNRYDEILDEKSSPANNYLSDLCRDWEAEAEKAEEIGLRRVSIRTGLVLDKNEGLLKKMLPTFKLFLGGYLGNGKQWFPWIHIDDIVGIYLHVIDNANIKGALNAASLGIVANKEFSKTLGKILSKPALLPVPKFILPIVSGELGYYVTVSQRISVDKILNSGYKFKFENLQEALNDLLN